MLIKFFCGRTQLAMVGFMLAFTVAPLAFAGPIGFVEAQGTAYVFPAGSDTRLNVNGSQAIFANDRIEVASGSLALNLNGGGSFSFSGPSAASVGMLRANEVELILDHGSISYALPHGSRGFSVRSAGVVVANSDSDNSGAAGSIRSGAIQRLANGELRTHARSGNLRVTDQEGMEHTVVSGEQLSIGSDGATKTPADDDAPEDDRRFEPAPRPQSIS